MTEPTPAARAVTAVAAHILDDTAAARAELYAMEIPELRALCQKLQQLASMASQTIVTKALTEKKAGGSG